MVRNYKHKSTQQSWPKECITYVIKAVIEQKSISWDTNENNLPYATTSHHLPWHPRQHLLSTSIILPNIELASTMMTEIVSTSTQYSGIYLYKFYKQHDDQYIDTLIIYIKKNKLWSFIRREN